MIMRFRRGRDRRVESHPGDNLHPVADLELLSSKTTSSGRCHRQGYVIRFLRVEFHRSTSKHGVESDDVLHAVAHATVVADMGDDSSPIRTLVLRPDHAGNMLEVILLRFDDGREMQSTPCR